MYLLKWLTGAKDMNGTKYLDIAFPDYDSTLAALDELEARIARTFGAVLEGNKRLTALEAKVKESMPPLEESMPPLEAKASYKKIDELERRINTLMGSIAALEPKVDAPRVSSDTWNVVSWKQCPKCGTWYCRSHNCDPNTCGTCKKAWRSDETTYIYCDKGKPKYASALKPACPCYERREA